MRGPETRFFSVNPIFSQEDLFYRQLITHDNCSNATTLIVYCADTRYFVRHGQSESPKVVGQATLFETVH